MVQYAEKERREFSGRLRRAARSAGLEDWGLGAELAKITGRTPKAASKWLSGESIPRSENLKAIAKRLNVSHVWLLHGSESSNEAREASPAYRTHTLVPQYNAVAECGGGALADHAEISGGLVFKTSWLIKKGLNPENLHVIYADGASMEPHIYAGDVVLFDSSDTTPRHNQVYVIRRPDGSISIKRLALLVTDKWLIKSDNPEYESEEASAETMSSIPIIGRVVWRGGDIF